MSITKELAEFCTQLNYEDLPHQVIDKAKYHCLDFIGVAARGSLVDSSQTMYKLIQEIGADPQGGIVIGTNLRARYPYAALANGTSAHSLELDDVNNEASLHPGVVIYPAALAAGELTNCNGKRFITAVTIGYEVMIRLGKALNPSKHYARGFHPTGTCGVFGAAAATSKILNLDTEQTINSLGIAGSQAAASMEFLTNGAWTKRMHPGWAAHNGMIAALLAQKGFKGPTTIIEGRFGFLHSYSDDADPSKILDELGKSYEITKTSIKLHACCRYEHSAIDGILKIMKENNLKAEEIKEAILGVLKVAFPIIVEPKELKYNPKNVVNAQFSLPFGAAVAILYGKASLDEHTQENINSARVREIMKRISCVENPELETVFPRQWPATVELITTNGRRFSTKIDYPKGDPENPVSWEELKNKFHQLSSPIYSEQKRTEIVSRVKSLETEINISNLASLL